MPLRNGHRNTLKPFPGRSIDLAHPLADRLWAFWAFNENGGNVVHGGPFGNRNLAISGVPAWVGGEDGPALTISSTQYGTAATDGPPNGALTVICRFFTAVSPATVQTIVSRGNGFNFRTNNGLQVRINEATNISAATPLSAGQWYTVAFSCDAAGAVRLYLDGKLDGTGSASAVSTSGTAIRVGRKADGATPLTGAVDWVVAFSRVLSDSEVAGFTADPYALFEPPSLRRFTFAGAPAPNTFDVVADVGAFALSGQSAGLIAGRKVSGAAGAIVHSGQDAGLKAARRIAADVGAYTFTGIAADLTRTTAGAYSVVASAGAFTLSGQAATLDYSADSDPLPDDLTSSVMVATGIYLVDPLRASFNR